MSPSIVTNWLPLIPEVYWILTLFWSRFFSYVFRSVPVTFASGPQCIYDSKIFSYVFYNSLSWSSTFWFWSFGWLLSVIHKTTTILTTVAIPLTSCSIRFTTLASGFTTCEWLSRSMWQFYFISFLWSSIFLSTSLVDCCLSSPKQQRYLRPFLSLRSDPFLLRLPLVHHVTTTPRSFPTYL